MRRIPAEVEVLDVADREFRIDGRENCYVRGFERTGFFEIDTGKDARSWTVQLTDPGQSRSQ